MSELPSMASASYASNTSTGADFLAKMQAMPQVAAQGQGIGRAFHAMPVAAAVPQQPVQKGEVMMRRLVQVFIADPDENLPLDNCLLYSGEQKITDLTDQELFFEIDIRSILEEHNKKRVGFTDKKVKERVEQLEAARIRDLKMTVVTIASF